MKVIFHLGKIKRKYKKPVIAIGVFDGLHHGHQMLLHRAVQRAREIDGTAMVMTFYPHPVHVLRPQIYLPLLVSLPYRLKLIEQFGIDICFVIHFTKRFSKLSPEYFIRRYLMEKINPVEVIVGDDFRFGQDRKGTLDFFRQAGRRYGFHVDAIQAIKGGKKTFSSSRIRQLISDGKLRQAARLLERPVSLMGRVVRGDARGKRLGYPTANVNPSHEVIPPPGVFLARVRVKDKIYPGMANIGRRPSFKKGAPINIEVHIFDFKKNLYDREIIIEFVKKIRDEKQFHSKKELIKQIEIDEKKARSWFKKMSSAEIYPAS